MLLEALGQRHLKGLANLDSRFFVLRWTAIINPTFNEKNI